MCPSLMQIGSKTAEKNSAQTDRQTNRHYENNGHLVVNQFTKFAHASTYAWSWWTVPALTSISATYWFNWIWFWCPIRDIIQLVSPGCSGYRMYLSDQTKCTNIHQLLPPPRICNRRCLSVCLQLLCARKLPNRFAWNIQKSLAVDQWTND